MHDDYITIVVIKSSYPLYVLSRQHTHTHTIKGFSTRCIDLGDISTLKPNQPITIETQNHGSTKSRIPFLPLFKIQNFL